MGDTSCFSSAVCLATRALGWKRHEQETALAQQTLVTLLFEGLHQSCKSGNEKGTEYDESTLSLASVRIFCMTRINASFPPTTTIKLARVALHR